MKINVLDHGYVEFVEAWGHGKHGVEDMECGIIEAARQSTQGTFRGWERDMQLLRYLYEHKHAGPFEFAGMVVEVQAPIFVLRTGSFNEMSARYSPLPDLYYLPTRERVFLNAHTVNRQAQGGLDNLDAPLQQVVADSWITSLGSFYEVLDKFYKDSIEAGIPKELARCVMPVAHYSRMRTHMNLRNWLAFLTLRMDPNAQWEIRQFANAVGDLIALNFPRTWELFNEEKNQKAADGSEAPASVPPQPQG